MTGNHNGHGQQRALAKSKARGVRAALLMSLTLLAVTTILNLPPTDWAVISGVLTSIEFQCAVQMVKGFAMSLTGAFMMLFFSSL